MTTKAKKARGLPADKARTVRVAPVRTVIAQDWEESERKFGVRPDGFTLHLSLDAHKAYVEAFWRCQKATLGESTPNEYTRACGNPKLVEVNETIYSKLVKYKDKNGLWGKGSWCPDSLKDPKHVL
jgi:hypothetical protein